jgi:AcrR family transcriptional regulator
LSRRNLNGTSRDGTSQERDVTEPTETTGAKRQPLSRDRVLHEAVAMADEEGFDALSMRKLAQRLGVEAMSIYYHVENKDALLDGMLDLIMEEVELPTPGPDWLPGNRRRAISLHDMLTRHAWAAPLMESRRNPGPAALRYYDAVLGSLRAGGFSVPLAAHAFAAIDAYVYGFGLQEFSLPFDEVPMEELAAGILEAIPPDQFPHLVEMITEHALQPGYDYGAEFAWGLDLILDGFERLRSAP